MKKIIVLTIVAGCFFIKTNAQTTQPITKKELQERTQKEKLRTPIKIDDAMKERENETVKPLTKKEKRKAKRTERRAKCRLRKNK